MQELNISDELRNLENFLRDNIMYILKNKYKDEWEEHLGVTQDRLDEWNKRYMEERRRLKGQVIENRLIYYSDFYDLKTIISHNWDLFKECFDKKSIMEYQLTQLESFRNPNAHNRDLLDYQKHLLIGYSGEIKNGIMKFRGDLDMISTFFPEFESLNINGEVCKYGHLKTIFRIGDTIEITIYVSSPNTCKLYYALCNSGEPPKDNWVESNHFSILIDGSEYGNIYKYIYFKSDSDYHMNDKLGYDGLIPISYTVVPNK